MNAVGPILGLILAGGLGRRMGGVDKALLPLAGKPLLTHVVERLAPQCPAGLILSANGDLSRFNGIFNHPILADPIPDNFGPLVGILAGMNYVHDKMTDVTHILSVPVDNPKIPFDLSHRLEKSISDKQRTIAVASSFGQIHYTIALWPVEIRSEIEHLTDNFQKRKLKQFVNNFNVIQIDWSNSINDPFFNINTLNDLSELGEGKL